MRPLETSFLRALPGGYECTAKDNTKYGLRQCEGRASDGAKVTTLYLWNPFGTLKVLNKTKIGLKAGDVLVINFGQHPASGQHWSTSRYLGALHETVDDLRRVAAAQRAKGAPLRAVWSSTPAFPLRCEGPVVQKKDWRTEPRTLLYNALASPLMLAHGIPFVDYHALTWPLSHAAKDHAHFFSEPFISAAGTALLNSICGAELSGKGKGGGGGEDPGALDPRALADGGAKSFGWLAGARRAYGSGAMRVLQPKVPGRKAGEGA